MRFRTWWFMSDDCVCSAYLNINELTIRPTFSLNMSYLPEANKMSDIWRKKTKDLQCAGMIAFVLSFLLASAHSVSFQLSTNDLFAYKTLNSPSNTNSTKIATVKSVYYRGGLFMRPSVVSWMPGAGIAWINHRA